jgi:hypothetical protein
MTKKSYLQEQQKLVISQGSDKKLEEIIALNLMRISHLKHYFQFSSKLKINKKIHS